MNLTYKKYKIFMEPIFQTATSLGLLEEVNDQNYRTMYMHLLDAKR